MKKLVLTIASILTIASSAAFAETSVQPMEKSGFSEGLASVSSFQYIPDEDMTLVSYAGGDPAMNGAHVVLTKFVSMGDGSNVFEIANVSSFKLLKSAKKGYLKLQITEDDMNSEGDIIKKDSILYVNVTKASLGIVTVEKK